MRETDCLKPASFYAATKAAVTYLTQIYSDRFGKNIVTVRPFSIYGPYEEQSRLIPTVIVSCLRGRILEITQGNEKRDFLYVKDIVEGYLKLMSDTVKLKGTIINFGSGRQHSTRDVVKLIHSLTKSKSKILWGKYPARNWDTNFWVADNNLAKKLIDWEPNYNLSDGITETIKWFKRHLYFYENKR